MTRCALHHRVFFWEEPVFDSDFMRVDIEEQPSRVRVVTPHLRAGETEYSQCKAQEQLLGELVEDFGIRDHVLWYYTPMAIHFTAKLKPKVVVYDCMDELTGFRGAPTGLSAAEKQLFMKADLVFTGGQSLYEHKKHRHPAVHCFPSSIDKQFFMNARRIKEDPPDQAMLKRPRVGYCGVIDERIDLSLVAGLANRRPEWQIVMLGPIAKIDPSDLPRADNIHYLGQKPYPELPSYFSGWDAGLLPFAHNEATRFISPTKTPEYLAAGLPAVSTSIKDVLFPYGVNDLAFIGDDPASFTAGVEKAIESRYSASRLRKVDEFLATVSWDQTWTQMYNLVVQVAATKPATRTIRRPTLNPVTVAS